MITGRVSSLPAPLIRLVVQGFGGQQQEIEALVDTGFNGWLTLPLKIVQALGLPWRRRGLALLADGAESSFDIYEATVWWDGQPRRIPVDAADAIPLVGMSLMKGFLLTVEVRTNGLVALKPLP